MLNKRPVTTFSPSIEAEVTKQAASTVSGSDEKLLSPLERALITTGRDSALRHLYLRKRWRGCEASQSQSCDADVPVLLLLTRNP
jgi:hypothetical protein